MVKIVLCMAAVAVFLPVCEVSGGWAMPAEAVSGTWGAEAGEFYFQRGDSCDVFPNEFGVDVQRNIFVNDGYNKRIQIFTPAGVLKKIIRPPTGGITKGWPFHIYLHPTGNFIANYEGPRKFFYDAEGTFVKKADVRGRAFPSKEGFYIKVGYTRYDLYSPSGEFVRTYSERPPELGIVKKRMIGIRKYKVTVTYPDKEWVIVGGVYLGFARDAGGNLYSAGGREIIRYDDKGNEVARLLAPENKFEEVPPDVTVIVEYGSLVLAPNGDVYTWKRTEDRYSIIRWRWR